MVNCINPYHFVQFSDKPWRGTIESGKKYTGFDHLYIKNAFVAIYSEYQQ